MIALYKFHCAPCCSSLTSPFRQSPSCLHPGGSWDQAALRMRPVSLGILSHRRADWIGCCSWAYCSESRLAVERMPKHPTIRHGSVIALLYVQFQNNGKKYAGKMQHWCLVAFCLKRTASLQQPRCPFPLARNWAWTHLQNRYETF